MFFFVLNSHNLHELWLGSSIFFLRLSWIVSLFAHAHLLRCVSSVPRDNTRIQLATEQEFRPTSFGVGLKRLWINQSTLNQLRISFEWTKVLRFNMLTQSTDVNNDLYRISDENWSLFSHWADRLAEPEFLSLNNTHYEHESYSDYDKVVCQTTRNIFLAKQKSRKIKLTKQNAYKCYICSSTFVI